MIRIYEGDPKIYIDENGASLVFKGGLPVMDGGLENAVIISLFTKKGWFGNSFFTNQSEKIGSDFEETVKGTINRFYFTRVEKSIDNALQWMIDKEIVSKIEKLVSNPSINQTEIIIKLFPPSGNEIELLLLQNGMNWIFQTTNPAYRRI